MNFKENKAIAFLIVLGVLVLGYFLLSAKNGEEFFSLEDTNEQNTREEISIGDIDIKEENFTGSRAMITGESELAKTAQKYIDDTVAEFKKMADTDVPDIREKFGEDSPVANYTIDIDARRESAPKTDSIIISVYSYTGGANGASSYRVFTSDKERGNILSLSDIIASDKKETFIQMVKKELLAWRPEGAESLVVFEQDVDSLKFENLEDWSLDAENLILYFDKYEIGPGALGAIVFPVPLSKFAPYLNR